MSIVFVTGATGLIGANICRRLREAGDEVRALVRPGSEFGALRELGVVPCEGDITDGDSVRRALGEAEYVIHSAAVLGGASQDHELHRQVNARGLGNVLDAAQAAKVRRTVALGTTTYFDNTTGPLTEASPLLPNPPQDPYSVSKRAAFVETMRRVDEEGLDACVVIPGGTFGPSPLPKRAMEAPSYNLRIQLALRGELDRSIAFPIPWSYADDVAAMSIAALTRGVTGEKYLAFAHPDDVSSTAVFLNKALEIAGRSNRVLDITADELDRDPALEAEIGPSLAALARSTFPSPYYRDDITRERLDHTPLRLEEALRRTVAWLKEVNP